jgi:DNA repair protein SbcD/Mre11
MVAIIGGAATVVPLSFRKQSEGQAMADFRFIHCADIHLDSPLRGLSAYAGAPLNEMRLATRQALANLATLAIEELVDFVVIAGDLYDGNWPDFQTGLYFNAQMGRLGRAGIRVYMVRGNHDAASVITRTLPRQDHVTVLSSKRPESVEIESLGVVIHGQSFASRAVTDDLAAHYPQPVSGCFNIGLLHTALTGRPDHDNYAPCRVEQLVNHGYQYWALGHIHAREVVYDQGPHIIFSGNLQGRSIREIGAKGVTLVTVRDGVVFDLEHRAVDVLRWALVSVDATGSDDVDQALSALRSALETALNGADGRTLAARVRFIGISPAHGDLVRDVEALREAVRSVASDIGGSLWIEKVEIATRPTLDRATLRGRDDAIGELLATLDDMAGDPEACRALLDEILPLLEKLPLELRDTPPELGEVEDMLLAALAESGSVS